MRRQNPLPAPEAETTLTKTTPQMQNPTLNDLNRPPIVSQPTIPDPPIDPSFCEMDESGQDPMEDDANIPSTSYNVLIR